MAKKKAKKHPERYAKLYRPPSIWEDINFRIKFGQKIPEKDMRFIENFVIQGTKIIDGMVDWSWKKRKLMEKHAKKLDDVRAYQLAHII
jgi:hypothetical protein